MYTYDNRGNLINESRDGVTIRTFEFDALGRMVRGTNELGETSEFEYNALGLRVANVQRILPGHMGGHGWDVNGYLTDEANSPGSRHINVNRMSLAELPTSVWLDSLDGYRWRDGWQDELPDDIPESAHQRIFKDNFGLNRNSGVVRQEFVIDYAMGFNQDLMVVEEGGFSTVFVYGTPLQRLSQHTTKADSIVSGVPTAGGALDPGGNVAADIAVVSTYRVLYYRLDFRNSTSQMQLPNGQYIAWTGYDDWGAATSPTDHDMNMTGIQDSVRFGSYTFDRILGLYYAQHRWYDAESRRFISPDPHWGTGISGGNMIWDDNLILMPNAGLLPDIWTIFQSTNLYVYCANNPVNFIDPRGLEMMHLEQDPGGSAASAATRDPVTRPPAPQTPQNNAPPRDADTPTSIGNTPSPQLASNHTAPRITPTSNPVPNVLGAAGAAPPTSGTGYFTPPGCAMVPGGMDNWLNHANDFFEGFRDGFIGYYQGLWNVLTNNPEDLAIDLLMRMLIDACAKAFPQLGTYEKLLRSINDTMNSNNIIRNYGIYGHGLIAGEAAGQLSLLAAAYAAGKLGGKVVQGTGRGIKGSGSSQAIRNPLENIRYTDKVKQQMLRGDYHSFSRSVDAFGSQGKLTQITGGDGVVRTKLEISGFYRGKPGIFEYIIEPDGITVNHRLFVPGR